MSTQYLLSGRLFSQYSLLRQPIHYARCLKASFQGIFRCQKGVPAAQNVNFVVSFLVMIITIEFISRLVSCFPAIGDVFFSRK